MFLRGHSGAAIVSIVVKCLPRGGFTGLVLSISIVLLLCPTCVHADTPRLVSYGQFSTAEFPLGITVDNSGPAFLDDIYVATLANGIDKFDGSGSLLSPPSPFGRAFYSGVAANPTNEELYLLNAFGSIETFDAGSGAPVGSPFPVPGSDNGPIGTTVVQIASDSAGDVYVPVVPENEVLEYSPAGGPPLRTFKGSGEGALKDPTGVTVDSSGDLWVADTGNNRIEELSPTGVMLTKIQSEGVQSLALDGRGDVFAIVKNSADPCRSLTAPCSHLAEYSSNGLQVADLGAGSFETGGTESERLPPMVAVSESSGRIYVSDGDRNLVLIFGPPKAPVIGKELSSEVGATEAKLGAQINPGGAETTYRIEYGTTSTYGQGTPFPEGSAGEGLEAHTVWASASGLEPGTTYHYRVVATNGVGSEAAPDQTFTTETAEQAACSNEELRDDFSARLPDCRAYELVTPSTKVSTQFEPGAIVALNGNAILFGSREPLPGAPTGGNHYVATRGAGGWMFEELIPLESYSGVTCAENNNTVPAYSDDLSTVLVLGGIWTRASNPRGGVPQEGEEGCNAEGVQVVSGEPLGYENLLLRDKATGGFRLVNTTPSGVTPGDAHFQGASSDLDHVIFSERALLTPDAPAGDEDLYEWHEGSPLRLVTVLPDGTPAVGSLAHSPSGSFEGHAVSADGSHVFFTAADGLYVRVNGSSTVQVDASQAGGTGGGGTFWAASADGSRTFFSDDASAGLTADTVPGSGANLYEYDVEHGTLTDLTSAGKPGLQSLVTLSQDGSYVYFSAEGSLALGAVEGQPNLYVFHAGATSLVTTIPASDFAGGQASPNGLWLALNSRGSLTGYDNSEPSGKPADEIFLYDAASKLLVCASCNPSGEAPVTNGGATVEGMRSLADSGRLFFQTLETLVPSDTNSQVDVYEYENGGLHLISSGTSSSESRFIGASETGNDTFFLSRQALVSQDTQEEGRAIYDARVGGGLAAQSSPPACTTADACRAPVSPQPSLFGSPASAFFSGAGNRAPPPVVKSKSKPANCRRGFVTKKVKGRNRCVRSKSVRKARKSIHAKKRGH